MANKEENEKCTLSQDAPGQVVPRDGERKRQGNVMELPPEGLGIHFP